MIKHRLFFSNMQKEEDWINRVIAKGYRLKSLIPGRYQFEKLDSSYNAKTFRKETESCCGFLPIVKLDFRKFASLEDFKDYVTLFEDSGWRHIAGNRSEGPQYFEKIQPNSPDDIFSDSTSSANRYWRMFYIQLGIYTLEIALIIVLLINIMVQLLSFSNCTTRQDYGNCTVFLFGKPFSLRLLWHYCGADFCCLYLLLLQHISAFWDCVPFTGAAKKKVTNNKSCCKGPLQNSRHIQDMLSDLKNLIHILYKLHFATASSFLICFFRRFHPWQLIKRAKSITHLLPLCQKFVNYFPICLRSIM